MNVDIVRFSEREPDAQVEMVRHLLTALESHPLFGRVAEAAYVNSTGDGLIAAFNSHGDRELPGSVCDMAASLIHACKTFDLDDMVIRVGLHFGTICPAVDGKEKSSFAVGAGLNWVSRVASVAAPGQVIASEEFLGAMSRRVGERAVKARFGDESFEAPVKHGRWARVRVLRGDKLSEAPPPTLARIERLGDHLHNALEIVAEAVVEGFRGAAEDREAATTRLRPRLTLWVPRDGELQPIPPRVELPAPPASRARGARAKSHGPPMPRTRWPLPSPGELPGNPLARAFVEAEPQLLLRVPSIDTDREGALRFWARHGVDEQAIRMFTRQSGAILAFPLKLWEPPAGVLCVDLACPVPDMRRQATATAKVLTLRSSYLLAALVHLRQN